MTAAIVCVGRLREKYYAGAAEEYLKRLSRFGKMEMIELPDLPEPANASDADRAQVMEKEGQSILSRIKPADHVIALASQLKSGNGAHSPTPSRPSSRRRTNQLVRVVYTPREVPAGCLKWRTRSSIS